MFLSEMLKAIIFGIVEGVTEWLPVSSTGHLILLDDIMRLNVAEDFYDVFEVVIQLGAICAVAVVFRDKLFPYRKSMAERKQTYRLWGLSLLGVIPSAVVGALVDELLDRYLFNSTTVALMLIAYGVAFIAVEHVKKGSVALINDVSQLTPKQVLTVGIFQTLALIPGTSRSGATILGAYLCGASRPTAAEFSFYLAIPTMMGAGLLKTGKFLVEGNSMTSVEIAVLLTGTVTAFAVSLVTIKFLTELVRRHSFSGFGVYRIALGALVIVNSFAERL